MMHIKIHVYIYTLRVYIYICVCVYVLIDKYTVYTHIICAYIYICVCIYIICRYVNVRICRKQINTQVSATMIKEILGFSKECKAKGMEEKKHTQMHFLGVWTCFFGLVPPHLPGKGL